MKTPNYLSKLACMLCLVCFSSLKNFAQSPNIILILTDDMGYADVGFNNGASDIATPNLDNLANNGAIFSSAYVVHPFCGPSRAGLMTGRYPHEFGAQFNLSDSDITNGVDTNETFFSTVLQNANYNTGIIGKWHLGQPDGYRPNQRGFDYFYGMLTGGHNYYTKTSANGGINGAYNRDLRRNEGLANESTGEYITDLFTDEGVTFINNAESNDSDPFFLFMSYNAPHTPLQALDSDKIALTSAPFNYTYTDNNRHNYAAMVYSVDRGVKKLVDALVANGEFDNTLIVFLSDNGGRTDRGALNTPLRGVKGDTFEGGFRVPMFMHWPNQIPAGVTYPYNVSALDLYPTFASLAGATIPSSKEVDGKNIINNVINNTDARTDESIYSIRHRRINNVGIRRGNLKAFTTGNGTWFLYDLNTNISESNAQNLANNPAYQDILNEMINDAYQWSLTHIEPIFFDSYGFPPAVRNSAEATWFNNNSSNNPSNTVSWQERTFDGFTTLSIEGIEINQQVSGYIYPNPVSDISLSIKFNETITDEINAVVYDALGRTVQMEKNLLKTSANITALKLSSNITNGNYFVKITAGNKSFSKAIIIDRN
ncbi:sulfatase-like hydrolase/transferase [uncultured Algibacter sp.]|uniref:sulfatase-like hydrolase/transferase n=1 Tax=uncultured Algibacter sp. TaxID=298659 RepID=UPI00321748B0